MNPKNADTHPHLCFVLSETRISNFFPLLQKGVMVKAQVGCNVMSFLREQIGLSAGTIEKIQSIFLDGRPVDDLDSVVIRNGSVLALSAAMPGLVGATLRRGGAYSSFRSTITYRETGGQCLSGEGFVHVKLFNLLMAELGPGLLTKGVFVKASDLRDFLTEQSGDLAQGPMQVRLDGKTIELGSLHEEGWLSGHDRIFLSVVAPA
jgi:hypothetical protein